MIIVFVMVLLYPFCSKNFIFYYMRDIKVTDFKYWLDKLLDKEPALLQMNFEKAF